MIVAAALGIFSKLGWVKELLQNKLFWVVLAVAFAFFAGYNSAKTKFTNYAIVAGLEAENKKVNRELAVATQAAIDSAEQLKQLDAVQIQQNDLIQRYQAANPNGNGCSVGVDLFEQLKEISGVIND